MTKATVSADEIFVSKCRFEEEFLLDLIYILAMPNSQLLHGTFVRPCSVI